MNILYCGDSNIADGVIISVISLLRSINEPLNIYILTASVRNNEREYKALSEDFADMLNRRVKEKNKNSSVMLTDITELFDNEPPTSNMDSRFTPCCMLRLYADLVPSMPDRILYLDNDVICRRSCSEFYEQDISDYELCGVLDYYGKWFFRKHVFKADYLNSGVLLLNLKKIRETGLFAKCRKRCAVKKMFMPDQSALNKLAISKKACPRRYNEQRRLQSTTVLQHFTTSFRFFPWVHTVSVKPWHIERVHSVLKLHEYDNILTEYQQMKTKLTETKRILK